MIIVIIGEQGCGKSRLIQACDSLFRAFGVEAVYTSQVRNGTSPQEISENVAECFDITEEWKAN